MPLYALAYRRDISLEKLHEYFASEHAQAHATTTSTECLCCGGRFTIVFVDKTNANNPDYCDSFGVSSGLVVTLGGTKRRTNFEGERDAHYPSRFKRT
jgi:hypothetical protein